MKRFVLPSVVALALFAADPTVFAADAKAQLKELVDSVKTKLAAGKRTEAELAEDLKKFDAVLEEHKGEKTDDVAQILFMKALLFAEVLENDEKAVELLKKLQADFPETAVAKQADAAIANLARQSESRKIQKSLAVGTQFPDFQVQDLEGKPLSVSQYKGKVVMIDFWATWCGPCIQELPNLLKAYEKYHDKGFEIIGISLDQEKEKLTTFIKEKNMTWPQHFDGKGWQTEVAQKYGINSIPATYLLDREGKIIAKGIFSRGRTGDRTCRRSEVARREHSRGSGRRVVHPAATHWLLHEPEWYMPDDPSITGAGDRDRININQEHELRYWSEKFGVSPEDLKCAVEDVGPMAKDVEKELRK